MTTEIKSDYRVSARGLMNIRAEQERAQETVWELRGILEKNQTYLELTNAELHLRKLKSLEAEVKAALSAELVSEFTRSGVKKFEGIGDIAIRRKVEYEDAPAIRWAISAGMHALLKVDRSAADKAFSGLADNLDFVEIVEEPFARVASKLEL